MLLAIAASNACGQSYWEMTPYRMQLTVAVDRWVERQSDLAARLPTEIVERTDNFVGAAWQVSSVSATGNLRARMLRDLASVAMTDLGALPDDIDQVLLLSLVGTRSGIRLQARDFDVRTQTWSTVAEIDTPHRELLPDAAFDVLWRAFTPIAQIEVDAKRNLILKPRAGALPLRDPALRLIAAGDLYRPIVRKVDRKGRTTTEGLQAVPWTIINVEAVDGARAQATLHSGLRQSLLMRRRGQSEQLAVAVRPASDSTLLRLVGRGKAAPPLPGYDVYAQVPGKKDVTHVGRTNSLGEIVIPAVPEHPVRTLYVKGGDVLLARLPLVPGLDEQLTAELADDDTRLALEGYLTSVQDNVIDVVARREILMARIRSRITAKKFDDAEKLFDELRRLPTREQIALAIGEQKTRNSSKDPGVQAKIDRAVAETQKSVRRFLDPHPIDVLRTELNQAIQAAPTATESASAADAGDLPQNDLGQSAGPR